MYNAAYHSAFTPGQWCFDRTVDEDDGESVGSSESGYAEFWEGPLERANLRAELAKRQTCVCHSSMYVMCTAADCKNSATQDVNPNYLPAALAASRAQEFEESTVSVTERNDPPAALAASRARAFQEVTESEEES